MIYSLALEGTFFLSIVYCHVLLLKIKQPMLGESFFLPEGPQKGIHSSKKSDNTALDSEVSGHVGWTFCPFLLFL